jgi:15-cis-phytoene synthase
MADPCEELVRTFDRDRYIATLFAPDDLRPHLFALYAFGVEIARIPTLVSEPQIGEIRLQWWLDTLVAIEAKQAVDHPVAQAFAVVVQQFGLPIEHLENFIEAWRNDLYADPFPSVFSLESFVAETDAAMMQFAAIILDRAVAAKASALVGPAGTAFGLARLLARPGLNPKFIPPGESVESLKVLARKRLQEARNEAMPAVLMPAVLPASLTELYLRGTPSALRSQWVMWRAARRCVI